MRSRAQKAREAAAEFAVPAFAWPHDGGVRPGVRFCSSSAAAPRVRGHSVRQEHPVGEISLLITGEMSRRGRRRR